MSDEEEKMQLYKGRLRAVGFISAAALAEPDEELAEWISKFAEKYLNTFLQQVDGQEDRELVEDAIEAFAVEAYETLHL